MKVDKNFQKIEQNADDLSPSEISTRKSLESRVKTEVPYPVFASIVRYVVRDGYMSQMLAAVTLAPSMEAVFQHTMQSGEAEIFNVTLVPDFSHMITKEESETNWLDTVEHMLVKFPNGSRTDACSGPIIHYQFNQENAEKLKNERLVMSVVSLQVKDGCENDFLDAVCASPISQLKIQRLIMRSDDRSYHLISIDSLERKIENEAQGLNNLDKPEPYLDFLAIVEQRRVRASLRPGPT